MHHGPTARFTASTTTEGIYVTSGERIGSWVTIDDHDLAGITPSGGFSSRDYGRGLKSEPEWGLQVKAKTSVLLEEFRFDRAAHS